MVAELSATNAVAPRERSFAPLALAILGVVVAVGWSFAARMLLTTALERDAERSVQQAAQLFDYRVSQMEERLRAESWLMSEDPRLKSALATQGIDESTINDLLADLAKMSGGQIVAVLTPAGRVQAVMGQDAFRGLDLSTSRFVREARERPAGAGGLWVIGEDLVYVAVHAMKFGDRVVAYFLLGQMIDERALRETYSASGAGMSVVAGGKVVRAVPEASTYRAATDYLLQTRITGATAFTVDGRQFFGSVSQIEGALPPAYVMCLRAWGELAPEYEMLSYILWVPAVLAVALALLFASRFIIR